MGVHWIDSPSKQSICIGILVLEAPCRSDKLFSAHTQIYFPAHRIIAYIPLFSSLRKGLRNPVFMQLSRLKCAFFIHHFAHFYFLQLIILRVNLIRTNEMWKYANSLGIQMMGDIPFYVGLDSADVWAHRENFLLDQDGRPTFIAGVPPDYCRASKDACHHFTICSLTLHSWFVRNWLFVDSSCNYNNINIFDVFEYSIYILFFHLYSLQKRLGIPVK